MTIAYEARKVTDLTRGAANGLVNLLQDLNPVTLRMEPQKDSDLFTVIAVVPVASTQASTATAASAGTATAISQ